MRPAHWIHDREAALGFAVAGVTLMGYPMLRPWGPETGMAGARVFASPAWVAAHLLAVVGFVSIALGLRALAGPASARAARTSETLAWLAAVLLLPYYGAESFGLGAVGAFAVDHDDPTVLGIAALFRYGPVAMTMFGLGLVLLAVVGIRMARSTWRDGGAGRVGGLAVATGLVTYLPQFFGAAPLRITHGVLLGVGMLLVAGSTMTRRAPDAATQSGAPSPASPLRVSTRVSQ